MTTWQPLFRRLEVEDADEVLQFSTREGHRLRLWVYTSAPRRRVEIRFEYVYGFQYRYCEDRFRLEETSNSFPRDSRAAVYRSVDSPKLTAFRAEVEKSGERWAEEVRHYYVPLSGGHSLELMAIKCVLRRGRQQGR